jgi:hypothetical protein
LYLYDLFFYTNHQPTICEALGAHDWLLSVGFFPMPVEVLDLQRGGDIGRFACATAAVVCCSSVGWGIFRPKMKLFPIKIATLYIGIHQKISKAVRYS